MSYVLILGAKSDIALALSKEYAKAGYDLYLAARNVSDLEKHITDLKIRHEVNIIPIEFDLLKADEHSDLYNSLNPKPIGVIFAIGYLGDQEKAQNDFEEAKKIVDVNFTYAVSILNIIANDFEKRGSGFIVGISSVAGDRGRAKNYVYGSSKAAFSAYLSGLRNRLFKSNVQVLTVKPGFVDTKMTKGMKLPKRLTAKPEEVAKDIVEAQKDKKDIIYTKKEWFLIMKA
ncbi:MAG: SDR family oxidoreductase, partial [Candidatus Micrarchaeaceae archaeon]